MIFRDAAKLVADIEYLPGWTLEFNLMESDWTGWAYMQWVFQDAEGPQKCRKWLIDLHEATSSDIVQTGLRAALDAAEHEVREQFKYKGRKLYGPHFEPDALVELAKYKKNLSIKAELNREQCYDCGGTGTTPSWPHTTCNTCKGSGFYEF